MLAWLVDAGLGTLWIGLFIGATFTSTAFPTDIDAENACTRINDLSNDWCIQFGSDVLVGRGGETAGVFAIWIGWVVMTTMIIPGLTGWSPGKLVFGLRVVNHDTFNPAGIGANIGRGLMWCFDAFPFFAPVFGLLLISTTKGHRRLGDRVARTIVIEANEVGRPVMLTGVNKVSPPPPLFAQPAPPPQPSTPPPPTGPRFDLGTDPDVDVDVDTESIATPPPPFPPAPSPPSFPPAPAPAPFPPAPAPAPPAPEPAVVIEPEPTVVIETEPEPAPEPAVVEPDPEPSPSGVDAPVWDEARDTYIQWDPDLKAWMQWNENQGRWVPISQ